jgi:hypothetical protein
LAFPLCAVRHSDSGSKSLRAFAELLFDHTKTEDLANYDAASLAFLAEQAWEHVQRRTAGHANLRVINPMMPNGREISVLEVLNDNMLAPTPDNCPNKSNFVARRFSCPQPALSCKLPSDLLRRLAMKAFLLACAAAIVIAAAGFVVLDQVQEPVQQAFATTGVRL